MALLSLGNSGYQITYTFNAPFTVLSGGPSNAFGGSSVYQITSNELGGMEGNGTIQFSGAFTSISWTVGGDEYWHGFTLAIAGVASVPEPSSIVLGCMGLVGLGGLVLRAKRSRH
jgi:PEP-CTERM motif